MHISDWLWNSQEEHLDWIESWCKDMKITFVFLKMGYFPFITCCWYSFGLVKSYLCWQYMQPSVPSDINDFFFFVAWILKIVFLFTSYNFHNESVQDQKHAEYWFKGRLRVLNLSPLMLPCKPDFFLIGFINCPQRTFDQHFFAHCTIC